MRLLGQPEILLIPAVRTRLPHLISDQRLPLHAYHRENHVPGLPLPKRVHNPALQPPFTLARSWLRRRGRGKTRALDVLLPSRVRPLPPVMRADRRPAPHVTIDGCGAELAVHDGVEDGFEVIQEDGVTRAFEYQRKPPVRIDSRGGGQVQRGDQDVGNEESHTEKHAQQHNPKPRVNPAERHDLKAIRFLNSVDELPRREDPPGIPHEGLPGPHAHVHIRPEAVEVGEVGPGFCDPEGLHTEQGDYEDPGAPRGKEGADFQPGDDVV